MKNIVIVDHNINMLTLIDVALKRFEFNVVRVETADEALRLVDSFQPPDLFILNLMTLGSDGARLCKQLGARKLTRDIPIIIFSVLNNLGVAQEILTTETQSPIIPAHSYIDLIGRVRGTIAAVEAADC